MTVPTRYSTYLPQLLGHQLREVRDAQAEADVAAGEHEDLAHLVDAGGHVRPEGGLLVRHHLGSPRSTSTPVSIEDILARGFATDVRVLLHAHEHGSRMEYAHVHDVHALKSLQRVALYYIYICSKSYVSYKGFSLCYKAFSSYYKLKYFVTLQRILVCCTSMQILCNTKEILRNLQTLTLYYVCSKSNVV